MPKFFAVFFFFSTIALYVGFNATECSGCFSYCSYFLLEDTLAIVTKLYLTQSNGKSKHMLVTLPLSPI